jgi:hypothetical protein
MPCHAIPYHKSKKESTPTYHSATKYPHTNQTPFHKDLTFKDWVWRSLIQYETNEPSAINIIIILSKSTWP